MSTTTSSRADRSAMATPPATIWQAWLTLWIEAVILFSVVTIAWRGLIVDGLFNWVSFGDTEAPSDFSAGARDYQFLLFCIVSALTIGFMVLLLFVVGHPFRSGERWAWQAIATSIATWFVIDSACSIATGFWGNAVLNTVLVAGVVPPLVATRRR
jgi:hypothetical protein